MNANSFRALRKPHYRTYFAGQMVSMTGTWMQSTILSWLIYQMTGSAFQLGLTTALRGLPILLFGMVAGVWVGNADNTPMVNLSGVSGAGWPCGTPVAAVAEPVAASRPRSTPASTTGPQ